MGAETCSCREDIRASGRHLAPGRSIAGRGGKAAIHANLSERMGLEECLVRITEMHTLSSESLEFAARDKDRNRLPAAGQFNLDTGFGLIDDSGKSGSRFSDRISSRHPLSVHPGVHSGKNPAGINRPLQGAFRALLGSEDARFTK